MRRAARRRLPLSQPVVVSVGVRQASLSAALAAARVRTSGLAAAGAWRPALKREHG